MNIPVIGIIDATTKDIDVIIPPEIERALHPRSLFFIGGQKFSYDYHTHEFSVLITDENNEIVDAKPIDSPGLPRTIRDNQGNPILSFYLDNDQEMVHIHVSGETKQVVREEGRITAFKPIDDD